MLFNSPILKNNTHGTFPNILHAQNLREKRVRDHFEEICNILFKTNTTECAEELTIVSTTNIQEKGFLQKSLERLGFNNLIILGANVNDWNFICKIELILNYLKNIKTEYILFCDSHDVIVLRFRNLLNKFLNLKCEMLINSEYAFWPNEYNFKLYNSDPLPDFITCIDQEKNLAPTNTPPFLNSGCWIANTKFATKFLSDCYINSGKKFVFQHGQKICPNDQPIFRSVFHKYYPLVKLDYYSTIFQTLVGDVWNNEEKKWKEVKNMRKEITAI
jgi:hypothetical protein